MSRFLYIRPKFQWSDHKVIYYFILSSNRTNKHNDHIHYSSIDKKVYQSIGSKNKSSKPLFTNINSLYDGVVSRNKLIYPIITPNDKIIGCYQVTFKGSKQQNRKEKGDFILLKLITMISYLYILKTQYFNESLKSRSDLIQLTKFTSQIWGSRNLKFLSNQINELLPEFLGFKSAALLLVDKEKNELFHIPVDKEDESVNIINNVIKFPKTMGITGFVIETQQIFYSNNIFEAEGFTRDIDNLNNIHDLYNFIFCPLFSSNGDILGLVQLHNKEYTHKINETDVEQIQ